MRPMYAECHYSACACSSRAHQQTTFAASTFRLQKYGLQRWASSSRQPHLRKHSSALEAAVPHRAAVTRFSLGNAGSRSKRARSAKQPGSAKASALSSSKSSEPDLSLEYSFIENWADSGFVPIITVGSVFTLAEEREMSPQDAETDPDMHLLLCTNRHARKALLDAMLENGISCALGTQIAEQGGRTAFWLSKESAQKANRSRNLFTPSIRNIYQSNSSRGGMESTGDYPSEGTLKIKLPRPLLHFLPKHFWLPGATKAPADSSGESQGEEAKGSTLQSRVVVADLSLAHLMKVQNHDPSRYGFQLEPDQEQCAVDTLASYQRTQQALRSKQVAEEAGDHPHCFEDAAGTSSSAHTSHSTQAQECGSSLGRQDLPVFRLPGVLVQLPTTVGMVCFSPVFLSKDQLEKTWAAIQAVQRRSALSQRKSERRRRRHNIELRAATLAGLYPGPVAPPEAAPVAGARPVQEEDEENMDEPPQVKPFMQEVAERALEPGLPNDGLPVGGLGHAVVSCATGTLSLGMRFIESVCNKADALISLTPMGRKTLGLVPDPLVSVQSLGALAEQFDVHNTRLLTKQAHEDSSGPSAEAPADSQTGSSPPGASSAVGVDRSEMNDSMAITLHLLIGNLAVDLVDVDQDLAMQNVAESGSKRPNGKPRDSGGQQQESTSNSFDVDNDPNQDRGIVPFDEFGGLLEATPDFVKEHSMLLIGTDQAIATGAPFDRDYELETLKGLLMIGHLDIDPEGKHLPWPIPVNGLGNGAHLATTDLRCTPGGPHDKAAPSGSKTRLARS